MRSVHFVSAAGVLLLLAALPAGVGAADLVALSVSPSLVSGRSLVAKQMHAIGTFYDGSTKDLTGNVSWRSSDRSVAAVGPTSGLVRLLATGRAKIIATASAGVTARAHVIVTA